MTQRLSHAIVASAFCHALVIALILAVTYLASLRTGKPLDLFELVAGVGDNYGATEAPALGAADGNPAVTSEPPAPSATMVMTTAPAPAAPKEFDVNKTVQKAAQKTTQKLNAQAAKEKAAEEKAAKEEADRQAKQEAAAKQAVQQGKMSKEEFDRLYKGKTPPAAAQKNNIPKVGVGIAGGVVGGSTGNTKGGAGGTALTAAQQSLVAGYTALLKQKLDDNLEDQKPPGLSDTLVATASMRILPSGVISTASIVNSSGNREFDKAVLDAIRLTKMPEPPKGFQTDAFLWDFKSRDKGNP